MIIDYFRTASATDKPACFGCGRPDPGSLSRPPWAAIHHHLEQYGWNPEDIAAEADRYRLLSESGIPVVLCDDCWYSGFDWRPGEAERLHSRARRFANETEKDYWRRHAARIRWANAADRKRRSYLMSAAFRWDYIWLLNNPGSELPYEAAP